MKKHKLEEEPPPGGVTDLTPAGAAPQGFTGVVDQYHSDQS